MKTRVTNWIAFGLSAAFLVSSGTATAQSSDPNQGRIAGNVDGALFVFKDGKKYQVVAADLSDDVIAATPDGSPVERLDQLFGGSSTDFSFTTPNGAKTESQLREELSAVGYGGPWDVSSMLIAYGQANSAPPPAQPAPPVASPGALYQADWSTGLNGWTGERDWKTVNGMLVSDGTQGVSMVRAPYRVPSSDYVVEASMQLLSGDGFCMAARWNSGQGYRASILDSGRTLQFEGGGMSYGYFGERRNSSLSKDWHLYRFQVQGNTLTLQVDGAPWLMETDNRFLSGSQIGVCTYGAQINVRSFRVLPPQ